ncbi:hypothetical protein ETH_00001010 [Eimeria tenella]|uniref:E3 ubiquitin-protein ligase n=1 Tax=Eimeria tenella TaxID=5802 RepID=U6KZC8_EIMTE|nr:hypothetical protein ETH_00001010 [Eimeria tenella]CDJ42288.1 hypothetical protein ETH_00001010 [Eimeria tenella]|eukprot:XP_013233038.1 hypothetical protein ETH_00001010 [Eimeria tenella]
MEYSGPTGAAAAAAAAAGGSPGSSLRGPAAASPSLGAPAAAAAAAAGEEWVHAFSRVRAWRAAAAAEKLAAEDDSKALAALRGRSMQGVCTDDLRLLAKRLPHPQRRLQLGAAALRIRPSSSSSSSSSSGGGSSGSSSGGSSGEGGSSSSCSSSSSSSSRGIRGVETYLLQVAAAKEQQEAHAIAEKEGGKRRQPLTIEGLSGVSTAQLDAIAPPYPLMEGLAPAAAGSSSSSSSSCSSSSSEGALTEEERNGVLLKVAAAGLVPWLKKVHLLLRAIDPQHELPFENADSMSAFGDLSCPVLPSGYLRSPPAAAAADSAAAAAAAGTLDELLASLKPYAADAQCDCLLETLPLPSSLEAFLFGGEDETEEEEATKETEALANVLDELQMVHAMAAQPPSLVAGSCLCPVVVCEKNTHEQLLQLLQQLQQLQEQQSPSKAAQQQKEELLELFRAHSFYFQPLTRRMLPLDFEQLLQVTAAKPLLLWQRSSSSSSSSNCCLAVFALQHSPCLTVLPKSYQQLYNHFLDVHLTSPVLGPHVSASICICLICGCLLCAADCCEIEVSSLEKETTTFSALRRHATVCGFGLSLFLQLAASSVLVVAVDAVGDRGAKWGCLHLDEYGEEDLQLRRGKPLRLSGPRVQRLAKEFWTHQLRALKRLSWARLRGVPRLREPF